MSNSGRNNSGLRKRRPTPLRSRLVLHYEIVAKIGEGGMGMVYKARNVHLDRFVAIKVLPPQKLADGERKRRFVHSHIPVIAAILKEEPKPPERPLPKEVARLIGRCLRKSPDRRFQTMADVKVALEEGCP